MKAIAFALAASSLLATPALAHEKGEREHPGMFRISPEDFGVFEVNALRGGRLGVQVSTMTEELRLAMGAPRENGILVNRVLEDSAAKRAGVQVGDVLVEVADQPVSEVADVWKALAGKEGDVKIEVIREKRHVHLTAKIEKPERSSLFPHDSELRRELEDLRTKLRDMERRLEKLEKK